LGLGHVVCLLLWCKGASGVAETQAARDWQDLLTRWNNDLLKSDQIVRGLPPDVVASGWLGYPGATGEQIRGAEQRLNVTLPQSYREFLQLTNGWRAGHPFFPRLWSTDEVGWFRDRNQLKLDAWMLAGGSWTTPAAVTDEKYFVYGPEQDELTLRVEYFPSLLEVSEAAASDVLLLNPQVVFADGEWEAWDLGTRPRGAFRYQSFWELMQAQYTAFVALRNLREPGS